MVMLALLAIAAVVVPVATLLVPTGSAPPMSTYTVTLLGKSLTYALLALALDLVWGYCGILSLGHGAFFALGGYAMGMYLMREIGARVVAWELTCFGRPAAGERFRSGSWDQSLELDLDDGRTPVLLERQRVTGGDEHVRAALRKAGVIGTLLAWPGDQAVVDIARQAGEEAQGAEVLWAVTDCDGLVVGRALGRDAELVRARLVAVWARLRPHLLEREPCAPRIWST